MASCHGLSMMANGKLIGDPLDLEMFKFTGWIIQEPNSMED